MNNRLPWDLIVLKLRHEELSAEEEVQYHRWLESDKKNPGLFIQLEIVWNKIQQKVEVYEPDLDYYWKELSARIEATPQVKAVIPESLPTKKMPFKRLSRFVAAASVALVIALGGSFFLMKHFAQPIEYVAYSTLNSKSHFYLPDSTEVWMNTNSSLRYGYDKKKEQREVLLAGEAFFKVRRDAQRVFLVLSKGVTVKVHGTQFNVHSYENTDNVLVSLFEGSVSMLTKAEDVRLSPGEEGEFSVSEERLTVRNADVDLAKIWTSDNIYFENKNLREVCESLSKWYGYEFDIEDSIPDNQSYTFTFRGESIDDVISILADIHSYSYYINNDDKRIVIRK